jgi:hypothetical protein
MYRAKRSLSRLILSSIFVCGFVLTARFSVSSFRASVSLPPRVKLFRSPAT